MSWGGRQRPRVEKNDREIHPQVGYSFVKQKKTSFALPNPRGKAQVGRKRMGVTAGLKAKKLPA